MIDQRRQAWMLRGWWALVGSVVILALVGAAMAGGEAYQLWSNPPTFCVPSLPRM